VEILFKYSKSPKNNNYNDFNDNYFNNNKTSDRAFSLSEFSSKTIRNDYSEINHIKIETNKNNKIIKKDFNAMFIIKIYANDDIDSSLKLTRINFPNDEVENVQFFQTENIKYSEVNSFVDKLNERHSAGSPVELFRIFQ